jgi:NtrC-family two-component system sensor histidine kinase KinB
MDSTAILYLIVSVLAVIFAFGLAYFASSSKAAKVKAEASSKVGYVPESAVRKDGFHHSLITEVQQVVESPEQREKIAAAVSNIVEKEVDRRIYVTKQELSKKYENIVTQKTENEEVAWKKYRKVLAEQKKTDAIIRSVAEGLVVVDAQGKVVMVNPAAERLLGSSKKDKIGKHITDDLKEHQLVSFAKGAAEREEREIELASKNDDTKKVLRASSAVIEDENGQTVGMVSVLSDITKQKELDNLKNTFVANVSHELRTPLVSMEKSLALILTKTAGEINKDQEQFLGIAQRNLKRLTLLINDLLDLSKLEAGKLQLKREPTSIKKVVEESVEGLNTWAGTKDIRLEKIIQEGLPELNIDPNRLIQVLNNLIGNAIKFTPKEGKVSIEAKLADTNPEIQVCVTDTGIGIPKENLPKIFSKFYQIGERSASDISGTGIGLSIAKEIVELHGGRIWVESEHGQGARFIFVLPLS